MSEEWKGGRMAIAPVIVVSVVATSILVFDSWGAFILFGYKPMVAVVAVTCSALVALSIHLLRSGQRSVAIAATAAAAALALWSCFVPQMNTTPRKAFIRTAGSVAPGMTRAQVQATMMAYTSHFSGSDSERYVLKTGTKTTDVLIVEYETGRSIVDVVTLSED